MKALLYTRPLPHCHHSVWPGSAASLSTVTQWRQGDQAAFRCGPHSADAPRTGVPVSTVSCSSPSTFVEVESGRKADRPQLAAALAEAPKRCAVVTVARLDRIARDAEVVLRTHREPESNGMGGFLFCDLSDVDATTSAWRLILGVMASLAELVGRRISERAREALAAAKARGVKLG
ncbi:MULTISPECIES: recombinase family protein [unclassified Synechococcus]|uniref:recombinase family protein n=1 Tax=unclassified Synechococcus TaxID=2626047 RepID=UPI0021A693D7|nr:MULTISPECIES: recombinase family protein [unclassified Synechococcus]